MTKHLTENIMQYTTKTIMCKRINLKELHKDHTIIYIQTNRAIIPFTNNLPHASQQV
jgi:hypothetical protein